MVGEGKKYRFVWKKNRIGFEKMNGEKVVEVLGEVDEGKIVGEIGGG